MAVTGPNTGFKVTDPNTNLTQDLGQRYVSKDYLLDVYPNIVPGRTVPGLIGWGGNGFGQLGNGTVTRYSSPIQVGALTNWSFITIGNGSVFGIKTNEELTSILTGEGGLIQDTQDNQDSQPVDNNP